MLQDFTKIPFDIIIQAGQSNSQGYGFGPVDKPYEPDELVWYMNENDTISLAVEKVANNGVQSNFALPFARLYIDSGKLAEGRKLLILRAAVGGTGFLDGYWKPNDVHFLHMMEMTRTALALNEENRLVALLWHQGESDAMQKATYDQHYGHLSTLVHLVRASFDVPNLPFIAGDLVYDWKDANPETSAPVVEAIRNVCRDCGCSAFVETDGLKSNMQESDEHPYDWPDDRAHFSRRSVYQLGERYFEKFVQIVG